MRRLLAILGFLAAAALLVFQAHKPASERTARIDEALVRWASNNARALHTTDPREPLDDLQWLTQFAAGTRVIALGEATHGTREFFQLKHRVVRYLVEREGFTTFAIEANLPEAEAVNQYVLTGVGDPYELVRGMHFWTWNTDEVIALIEWMRAWNAAHHDRTVTFHGFDAQYYGAAARTVSTYLENVDPAIAGRFRGTLVILSTDLPPGLRFSDAVFPNVRSDLDALQSAMQSHRHEWTSRLGERQWELTQRYLRVMIQAVELRDGRSGKRDAFMAENVRWILARERGKAVLWAHNGHVARAPGRMGAILASSLGSSYAAVGFAFGEGTFRARTPVRGPVTDTTVTEIGGGDFDQGLSRVRLPLFALEVRHAPRELVRPLTIREYGGTAQRGIGTRNVFEEFDVILFVRQTTGTRPAVRRSSRTGSG